MKQASIKEAQLSLSAEGTHTYIVQMLEELSSMAQKAGKKELGTLLRATVVASRVALDKDA